jgi:plastocyanin
MTQTTRSRASRTALVVLVAAFVGGLALTGTASAVAATPRASAADAPVVVQAGINDSKDTNIVVTEFLPAKVTVENGAAVTWSWKGAVEPHSVTFFPQGTTPPPPGADESLFLPTPPTAPYIGTTLVNSGLQPLGNAPATDFTVTFDEPGDWPYYCVIHPGMIGTVKVLAPGGDVAKLDTAASAKARGAKEEKRWLAEGVAAKKKLATTKPTTTKGSGGATTWNVEMGVTTAHTDILAFSPAPTKIKAGDSIQFVNNSQAPHTGTFRGATPGIDNPLAPETSTAIPGASPQTLNATALFNTGELAPKAGEPAPPIQARSFTFVVPTAGTYPYYCILHIGSGMATDLEVT